MREMNFKIVKEKVREDLYVLNEFFFMFRNIYVV